jgi:DNA end-binding protein Ku
MAARAIWKGRVRFGEVDVPVKLFSAVQDRTVHFRLLDAGRGEPVRQEMVTRDGGRAVEPQQIRKAFPTEDGDLVILEEEDLAQVEPEPSRDIHVTRFVPPDEITHRWYDRPYYLGPDGEEEAYFALHSALRKKGREGVARWVMRKKEYVGALRVEGDYLMLITLRHAGEVVAASALRAPGGRDLDERELRMARQLVAAMEDDFDIAAYRDEYRDRVLELVKAKAAGKVIRFPKAPARAAEKSLADVLERSLAAAAGKGKAPAKGKGRKSA